MHSARQIKITDFGLAKLLDDDVESYQGTGGKVNVNGMTGVTLNNAADYTRGLYRTPNSNPSPFFR